MRTKIKLVAMSVLLLAHAPRQRRSRGELATTTFNHRRGPVRMKLGALLLTLGLLLTAEDKAPAQLVADGQTNILSGGTVSLSGDLTVGTNGPNTTLIITNGGSVSNTTGYVGYNQGASNNQVIVTGTNSAWNNSGALTVGQDGSDNTLLITNGGTVSSAGGFIGYGWRANNNQAIVSGPNSAWNNSGALVVGRYGSGNTLLITDGGTVSSASGLIGDYNGSGERNSNNQVTVTGPNSTWNNNGALVVGQNGSDNTLLITDGGTVSNTTG